ncbi:hypothetical protein diail_7796 [Diaporthe ilicicola]|nr:hypothetical protein diail_7796 [Diaporthe ilicicola]
MVAKSVSSQNDGKSHVQMPLAIIGMACRLPGSCNNPKAFWDFLESGGIASRTPPKTRFEIETHYDGSTKRNTMASPGGMFIDADPRDLDASFFKLPASEAIAMDPQQRQLLEVVYEGLENAGIPLEAMNGHAVGCFVGSYACDYGDIQGRDPEDRAQFTTLGTGRAMLSNRISHWLNIKGPSMTVDTACSGSLIGVDLANRYLQTGEIYAAIVAGCNIYLSPDHVMDGLSVNGTASLSGLCHSFDMKADGYIKAEAVNMVLLKRLEDAIRDEDPIRGIIRGTATGSDGWTAGIASPNASAQAATIQQAYSNANIPDVAATSYVECHGTGTQAGDAIEVSGLASIFSSRKSRTCPLRIGSVKSNIGHSEPAAGISGLLKVLLAMEHGIIPGNPTFVTPNPKIDFDTINLRLSRAATPWDAPQGLKRAGVNSFGYGGSNAHVIVESVGVLANHVTSYTSDFFLDQKTYSRPYLMVFSANDQQSLQASVAALDRHLSYPGVELDLRDVAYTLSEKRTRHFYRGYISTSKNEISAKLLVQGKRATSPPKIGLIFAGQGSQWPQMGKQLISTFPVAKSLLEELDEVLGNLEDGPAWSILEELSQGRSEAHYRNPELSQTLITALQLAILALLDDCNAIYHSVAGHSSGEVAAAVAAGFLTPQQAIKVAYYRGKATSDAKYDSALGMMAVGLGQELVRGYLSRWPCVQVACINSPTSTTLSGLRRDLLELEQLLKKEGHFARILRVDAAYHSSYMDQVAIAYRKALEENCDWTPRSASHVSMYSSVKGGRVSELNGVAYWEQNMVSPVLFNDAVQDMLQESLDILIEISPSNSLSGPIEQIMSLVQYNVEYAYAWKRGPDALSALGDLVGKLFIRGSSIKIHRFNFDNSGYSPSTIVDLPNYCWNHSTKYWHESSSSKDWRFRKFIHHDLLGSKVLGTPWHQPIWSKVLRVEDVPWLRDHRIGETIVFPAAGYLSMAIEAAFQMQKATGNLPPDVSVNQAEYQLRNCRFWKAMTLGDVGSYQKIMLTLTPGSAAEKGWLRFVVYSLEDGIWNQHCNGLIRTHRSSVPRAANDGDVKEFELATPTSAWYKIMSDVGYRFGPSFQKSLLVESTLGLRQSRSMLSFEGTPSSSHQSIYPLHPTSIDACFQAVAGSIWAGDKTAVNMILVPDIIHELTIPAQSGETKTAIATSASEWIGVGNPRDARSYASSVSAYDEETHQLLFQMNGLRYQALDAERKQAKASTYCRSVWEPDVSFPLGWETLFHGTIPATEVVHKLLDMIAFKHPDVRILEHSTGSQSNSLWHGHYGIHELDALSRNASSHVCLEFDLEESFVEASTKYQGLCNTDVRMINDAICRTSEPSFDVLITTDIVASRSRGLLQSLRRPSYLIIKNTLEAPIGVDDTSKDEENLSAPHNRLSRSYTPEGLQDIEFSTKFCAEDPSCNIFFGIIDNDAHTQKKNIELLRFHRTQNDRVDDVIDAVRKFGWEINCHVTPFANVEPGSKLLILDEIFSPVLSEIDQTQWENLQRLLSIDCRVLWVTTNAQMTVQNPDCSLVQGFARSIRNESPQTIFMTLDVEYCTGNSTFKAIHHILDRLTSTQTGTVMTGDNEFVERAGIIHIERVVPDDFVNTQAMIDHEQGKPEDLPLFEHEPFVHLVSDRVGTLKSLCYVETSADTTPLPDGHIEVDIHALSLNFKDLAIVMGIIPGDEQLLGLDGAGTVRRLGKGTGNYYIGQRVLANTKGCFANRVQCNTDGEAFALPESIPFEAASTLNTVYSTALYSLTEVAGIRKGQSVLIHSAAGGLGIAAVQLCIHFGAEIYATVGNDEKRAFLTTEYNVLPNRIFSSRSTDFSTALMEETKGKGVDIILNTLSGEMLHASWQCIATGGTFVELGKRDILDKASISMEPFGRNASYRAVDMSHESISLLSQILDMVQKDEIKPVISKTFGFEEPQEAFRYLSTGHSIGKIVRKAIPALNLDPGGSYIIVGGLKGICGSMAVYLAQQGAKSLIASSRSSFEDEKSKKVAADIAAMGAKIIFVTGDVTNMRDVDRLFNCSPAPIRGIIHGAMVLKDKMYSSMTQNEFRVALSPKVQGAWNLHHASLNHGARLDFFTLLSSICGVIGQKGQANYSAANSFLDAFATYRNSLGLPACSVDLGVVEDVGYVNNREALAKRLLAQGWAPINELHLHKILRLSIIHQKIEFSNSISSYQIITGIPVPLPKESPAQQDARFRMLRETVSFKATSPDNIGDNMSVLRTAFNGKPEGGANDQALLGILSVEVNDRVTQSLGLSDGLDPERPLADYGIDSLVAMEFRNWLRTELAVEIATLEVIAARTLTSLCKAILRKGLETGR